MLVNTSKLFNAMETGDAVTASAAVDVVSSDDMPIANVFRGSQRMMTTRYIYGNLCDEKE